MVTVSYGNGFVTEFDDINETWTETEDGNVAATTLDYSGYLRILVASSANNKVYYVTHDMTNLSSTIYAKIRFRYICGNSSLKAKIVLVFTSGTQEVLVETNSTALITGVVTITTDKTIDSIRLYANGDKGTGDCSVYYECIQIFTGTFTLPNANNIHIPLSILQDAIIPIPLRSGTVQQPLGSGDLTVTMDCDLDIDNDTNDWQRPQGTLTKATYEVMNGQVFLDILHNLGKNDLWQWLDLESPPIQFKARLTEPSAFEFNGDGHVLRLAFREYRESSASNEYYYQRWGLNL